jgi:hypothetical protein
VQRLQALETREKIAEKKHEEWLNRNRSNGSNADHAMASGNSKSADKRRSDMVQVTATLELSLQNSKGSSSHAESGVSGDGPKQVCTKNIAAKGTSIHADLEPNVHTHLEEAIVHSSTSTSKSVHACANPKARGIRRFKAGGSSNQQKTFSAKYIEFATKTTVCQYRPRYSGGSMIKLVEPGTKPRPQWCPTGLTHTQKRRVQRLRAPEIKEDITLKKRDELFRRDRSMVPPNMNWREKRITMEGNRNTDDTLAAQNFENNRDTPTDMNVDQ